MAKEEAPKGAFITSLKRTATQVRDERAEIIQEGSQRIYKRSIEDMEDRLKDLQRMQRGSLDLSPDDVNTIISANSFDPKAWVERDIARSLEVKKLKVKIDAAKDRYAFLFGDDSIVSTADSKEAAIIA
jgi:hypothetical protein